MKKKHSAIPDFSRKRPGDSTKVSADNAKQPAPNPRTAQKPPAQTKSGGRRGG